MSYSERLNDMVILKLDTTGFEELTPKNKQLAYHLSQAGLWGRFISLDQGSEYNIPLIQSLMNLYKKVEKDTTLSSQLHDTLFTLFTHNGIYHSMSGELLSLPLDLKELQNYSDKEPELVAEIKRICFEEKIPQFRTTQTEGVDVVAMSGGNFYKNLTTQEVNAYRSQTYPKHSNDEIPPYGFNERLVKNEDGAIERQVIGLNGLYGNYVAKIIESLDKALEFTENDKQHKSISTLIDFYKTGEAKDFDTHCIAWTQDQDSDIYYINGLIESYEDHH